MLVRLALAALGAVELLFPRTTVDWCLDRTTADRWPVEVAPWVYPAVRAGGALLIAWALLRTVAGGD